jgi:hypothetical protein
MKEAKEVTEEEIERYLKITEEALKVIKLTKEAKKRKKAEEILDMAQRYFSDAKHYKEKGNYVTAFAAVNYAHGWLDAGVRCGLLKAKKGTGLFMIDD